VLWLPGDALRREGVKGCQRSQKGGQMLSKHWVGAVEFKLGHGYGRRNGNGSRRHLEGKKRKKGKKAKKEEGQGNSISNKLFNFFQYGLLLGHNSKDT